MTRRPARDSLQTLREMAVLEPNYLLAVWALRDGEQAVRNRERRERYGLPARVSADWPVPVFSHINREEAAQ
jgi:hypothetical protein